MTIIVLVHVKLGGRYPAVGGGEVHEASDFVVTETSLLTDLANHLWVP